MAELGEAMLQTFDLSGFLWTYSFHILPGLPASVSVQRCEPRVIAGVAGTYELPHHQLTVSITDT